MVLRAPSDGGAVLADLADQLALAKGLETRTNEEDGDVGAGGRSHGLNLGDPDERGVVRDEAWIRNEGRFGHQSVELNGDLVSGESNHLNLGETTPWRCKLSAAVGCRRRADGLRICRDLQISRYAGIVLGVRACCTLQGQEPATGHCDVEGHGAWRPGRLNRLDVGIVDGERG